MNIKLADEVVFDSIVDGNGLRAVIYTQGCRHHCESCHNPQTWAFDSGICRDTKDIVKEILDNELNPYITFSGGDPFEQPTECLDILLGLKEGGKSNFWAYTGYTFEALTNKDHKDYSVEKYNFLKRLDVLVDGMFMKNLHSYNILYRGSSNQRIIDVKKSLIKGEVVLKDEYM